MKTAIFSALLPNSLLYSDPDKCPENSPISCDGAPFAQNFRTSYLCGGNVAFLFILKFKKNVEIEVISNGVLFIPSE